MLCFNSPTRGLCPLRPPLLLESGETKKVPSEMAGVSFVQRQLWKTSNFLLPRQLFWRLLHHQLRPGSRQLSREHGRDHRPVPGLLLLRLRKFHRQGEQIISTSLPAPVNLLFIYQIGSRTTATIIWTKNILIVITLSCGLSGMKNLMVFDSFFCSTSLPLTTTRWLDQYIQAFHTLRSAVD